MHSIYNVNTLTGVAFLHQSRIYTLAVYVYRSIHIIRNLLAPIHLHFVLEWAYLIFIA